MVEKISTNYDLRRDGVPIDVVVFHYTGMKSAEEALNRMTDSGAKVSAHYMVDEAGLVFRLVPEDKRAWHAGISSWRGNTDINSRSIGIELVNPGHQYGYRKFPSAQMVSLIKLSRDILSRHSIPARNILAHSDVAPSRKLDPGELFDWKLLANSGVGLWPLEQEADKIGISDLTRELSEIGYDVSIFKATVKAFQRRFRPKKISGYIDSETARLILGLVKAIQD